MASPNYYMNITLDIKLIEEKLAGQRFLRVHKSFIIAVDKITVINEITLCE
jgi:DNA-binding LytR/AlgR family response regulator